MSALKHEEQLDLTLEELTAFEAESYERYSSMVGDKLTDDQARRRLIGQPEQAAKLFRRRSA